MNNKELKKRTISDLKSIIEGIEKDNLIIHELTTENDFMNGKLTITINYKLDVVENLIRSNKK